MTRWVQVIPSLVMGGAEALAVSLAEEALAQGHDAWLLVLKSDGPMGARLSPELRARTVLLDRASRWEVASVVRAARWLRELRPDVVHLHLFTSLAWGAVAARLAGVPCVMYTEHACHPDDEPGIIWLRRALSMGVDVVVGCSAAATEAVVARKEAPFAPVLTIPNGLSLAGRPRAQLDGADLHVGTVGRLTPIKGQRYLLDAVALLRDRGQRVQCTLVGDGELRAELEAQVEQLQISDRVTFTGVRSDVPALLATFDLFVLPSLSEAMPMTLLEAAAAGLPLVVTTGGGASTLLDAGAGGVVVPSGSAAALADAISAYASMTPSDRRAEGERSAKASAAFGLDACLRAYQALAAQVQRSPGVATPRAG